MMSCLSAARDSSNFRSPVTHDRGIGTPAERSSDAVMILFMVARQAKYGLRSSAP